MASVSVLKTHAVSKLFGHLYANENIDFDLFAGEIHALLGENGAGKSTFMNILSGLYQPTNGDIYINGQLVSFDDAHAAMQHGIHMVHQHFMLVPVFTVAENIFLGRELRRGPFLDLRRARRKIRALSEDFGLKVDPDAVVEKLPLGLQQRVEILKALYGKARILILDEPTSVLAPQEVDELFGVMRHLAASGVAVIFITHKLEEVMHIADRITVMRQGRIVPVARVIVVEGDLRSRRVV